MGNRASETRRKTRRTMRHERLTQQERGFLHSHATYEGVPYHKRSPGDFGLEPPASPRPDKTLCDEANVTQRSMAIALLARAIDGGLVSESEGEQGFPKQLWAVDEQGQVFEAMYGGSRPGSYHGYPIRRNDPWFDEVIQAWRKQNV